MLAHDDKEFYGNEPFVSHSNTEHVEPPAAPSVDEDPISPFAEGVEAQSEENYLNQKLKSLPQAGDFRDDFRSELDKVHGAVRYFQPDVEDKSALGRLKQLVFGLVLIALIICGAFLLLAGLLSVYFFAFAGRVIFFPFRIIFAIIGRIISTIVAQFATYFVIFGAIAVGWYWFNENNPTFKDDVARQLNKAKYSFNRAFGKIPVFDEIGAIFGGISDTKKVNFGDLNLTEFESLTEILGHFEFALPPHVSFAMEYIKDPHMVDKYIGLIREGEVSVDGDNLEKFLQNDLVSNNPAARKEAFNALKALDTRESNKALEEYYKAFESVKDVFKR